MNNRGLCALALMLMAQIFAGVASAEDDGSLLSRMKNESWGQWNEQAINGLIATKVNAKELLNELYEIDGIIDSVSDYRFVDLNGDGTLELLAIRDITGRGFYTGAIVLWKRGQAIVDEEIDGSGMNDTTELLEIIKDMDGDGQMELVMPTLIGEYHGADTEPVIVPRVYAIQGAGYAEASRNFKRYYREVVIPQFQTRLEIARSAKHTRDVEVLQKQLSECQRILNE